MIAAPFALYAARHIIAASFIVVAGVGVCAALSAIVWLFTHRRKLANDAKEAEQLLELQVVEAQRRVDLEARQQLLQQISDGKVQPIHTPTPLFVSERLKPARERRIKTDQLEEIVVRRQSLSNRLAVGGDAWRISSRWPRFIPF